MSKADAQRAMREAKYARNRASAPSRPEAAAVAGPSDGERCGHKSMNGRVCTREASHSEKTHRYG